MQRFVSLLPPCILSSGWKLWTRLSISWLCFSLMWPALQVADLSLSKRSSWSWKKIMLCQEDGCRSFIMFLWVVKMPNQCLIICLHPFAFDYWLLFNLFKLQRWAELWIFLHKRIRWVFFYVYLVFSFGLLNRNSMSLSSSEK